MSPAAAPVNCRPAGPDDAAAVHRLLAAQLAGHHVAITDDALQRAIDGVVRDPARGLLLVAERDGACVGVAYVSYLWALEHGGHAAWLEELYVDPAHRGAGIGAQLLEAVLAAATAAGCAALDLEIDAGHERVRSLYERYGFTALPRRRIVRKLPAGT